ncbi:MAG: AsmA family protein [Pseudomonadota bacterium]|nr:AsmA family protein [Pseudomonadota bacterium]MDP1903547.1 AsmA family protein [Pseudomonadota bacterium]MDP2351416.1 AsmA family protein [Pseudomonadota bacterium]
MPKTLKKFSFAIGALIGLLVLIAIGLRLFLDVNAYKPRFEAAASGVLGVEVSVGGRLGIGFFPGLLVTLEDVRIRNRGTDIVTAKVARLGIEFLPLLQNKVRIETVALEYARISIEKGRDGKFNFEKSEATRGVLPALNLARISLTDGTLLYADKLSGKGFEAENCGLDVRRFQLSARERPGIMKYLSLAAELDCGEVRTKNYAASDLKFSVAGTNGVFDFKPLTMNVFGVQGLGSIRADFAGAIPLYQVHYSLPRFHIEALLKTLSPQNLAAGSMDLTVDLLMRGKTMHELRRTARGNISLRGKNLILEGRDLDQELARYETSQNFNLVDVGAYILTGPIGLVVTKGYDFARIVQKSGGRSEIRTFVSDWKMDKGVARAQDVAMATNENRIALRGSLDFANERFAEVTVALIDARGCATLRQTIRGSFQKPVVEKPSTLKALTGPVLKLFNKARGVFPGGECDVFYAGSVAPPK